MPPPSPDPLTLAFPSRPDLRKRAHAAIAHTPSLRDLFTDIATYISTLHPSDPNPAEDDENRAPKKRKLDPADGANGNGLAARTKGGADDIAADWEKGSYCTVKDISFSVPQRKKLVLEVGPAGVRARNAGTGGVEFGNFWGDIQHVLCVPLPEKAQPQYAFVVFAARGEEAIVWTVADGAAKVGVVEGGAGREETLRGGLVRWMEEGWGGEVGRLGGENGKGRGWVKGFRGSKDGYLFFLPTGLLWGFKKPLFFFPFARIESVSYTSVLQRTFNLNVTVTPSPPSTDALAETTTTTTATTQDFEFSMLDQLDFACVDAYIRTHGLHDASMAEQRRAKKLNINGVKQSNADTVEGGVGEDGVGELEKAEREVRDLEDGDGEEEDENFDPGSEGESEGSGSSEEEGDEGGDLVGEGLGSEAEEVDTDGDE